MLDANALSQLNQLKSNIQASKDYAEGEVAATGGRFGFVRTDDGRDAYLAPDRMEKVLPGDRVKVSITENKDGKLEAALEKLLTSEITKFVGQYRIKGNAHFVVPQGGKFNRWIFIPPKHRKNAAEGEFVVAKMSRHPFSDGKAQAHVLFRIGAPEDPYIEHKYVKAKYDLNYRIEDAAKAETDQIAITTEKLAETRTDISEALFFTIDSPSTLDMDDALSITRAADGYLLTVAIAAPGEFINESSALATQALSAGQTVYLAGGAVPMLPAKLAHHAFSLEENKVKAALICQISISADGALTDFSFTNAAIKSAHKLNYAQVAEFLQDDHDTVPEEVKSSLTLLLEMSSARRRFREQNHVVMEEQDDYDFKLDDRGHIAEILSQSRNLAQQIVEESMIATNMCAGEFLQQHKTGLHSVHLGFREDRLGEVKALLKEEELPTDNLDSLEGYLALLHSLKNDESKQALVYPLRRMMRASEISAEPGPHFGLGLPHYATITSPIRRFADLYNHWCIQAILSEKELPKPSSALIEQLNKTIGNGRQADRELHQWLICLFTANRLGTQADGKIRIVTQQGFGVKIIENGIEGFVLFDKKAEKTFDAKRMTLQVGAHAYRMGDTVSVKIKSVDLDKRRIAFELADAE